MNCADPSHSRTLVILSETGDLGFQLSPSPVAAHQGPWLARDGISPRDTTSVKPA
jgi:hypothetical protein